MATTKKNTFKNPVEAFISVPEGEPIKEETPVGGLVKAPEGYKRNPEFIEVRSKRVQLLLQPSVVDRMKALAKSEGASINEMYNRAVAYYLEAVENQKNE